MTDPTTGAPVPDPAGSSGRAQQSYGQPPAYGQAPAYGQPPAYGQAPAYGQQSTMPPPPPGAAPQMGYAPGVGYAFPAGYQPKSKLVAGLLGIFLGGLGIHRFYLGYTGIGILQIVVTIVTLGIGNLWGFIEGIVILCTNDPNSNYSRDARGVPLTT